jgi:hypothetical protein
MTHNFMRNDNFNILTARREKGHLIFTGETREPLKIGDYINYPYGEEMYCLVDKIKERRDATAYPEGNSLFYCVECSGIRKADMVEEAVALS